MNRKMLLGCIIFFISIMVGCSSSNPTEPKMSLNGDPGNFDTSIIVTDWDINGNPVEGMGALGAFEVLINTVNLTGELHSIRETQSKDVLEIVDITNFLTLAPCVNCVKLKSIQLDTDNNLVLTIGIKHPFDTPNPADPVTGRNRADLHVFNIEGTIIFKDDPSSVTEFQTIDKKLAPITLVNADGYSPYLDTPVDTFWHTEANVHPYKLHFFDFSIGNFDPSSANGFTDFIHPTGNLVMAMGSAMDYKDYVLDIDESVQNIEFIFAVGCTYGISAINRNFRFNPTYRLPQFNKKAASCVWIDEIIEDNDLGFEPGDISTSETIILKVLDMNHGYPAGDGLDQMRHTSDIDEIDIEIPSITNGVKRFTDPFPTGGSGRDPLDPLTYSFTLANELGAPAGDYAGLIKVLDTYLPNQNEIVNGDGISRVSPTQIPTEGLFTIPEFATYAAFEVKVEFHNDDPVACFVYAPLGTIQVDLPVRFDGTCSYDPDNDNLTFEWDYDYDGSTFNIDGVGQIVFHPYTTDGTYTVALRVTDDGIPPKSSLTTRQITISPSDDLTFGANIPIFGPVAVEGPPIGQHYADSEGSKIYVVTPSDSSPQNLYCVRSDNRGSSFVLPEVKVNDFTDVSALFQSAGISIVPSGNPDISWVLPGFPGYLFHDRAYGAYNFGTDSIVDPTSPTFPLNISHSTFAEDYVFTGFSRMDLSLPIPSFRIVLSRSTNSGATFSNPVDVVQLAGGGTTGHYYCAQVLFDDTGKLHVVLVSGNNTPDPGQIKYTRSNNYGNSFSGFKALPTPSGITLTEYRSISMAVSPSGTNIYVVYRSQSGVINNIYLVKSTNNGNSFDPPVLVDDRPNNCDLPCIVVDDFGWLYVCYEDRVDEVVPVSYNIRVSRSRDGGSSFEPSVLVNDDVTGAHQITPCLTVDDLLNVHVFWKDDRETPGVDFKLYYAKGN